MSPVVRGTHCPLLATMQDGKTRSTRAYAHHRDGRLVPVRVTASVGATLSRKTDTPESLVVRADRARYKAKQNGRDTVALAPPQGDGKAASGA